MKRMFPFNWFPQRVRTSRNWKPGGQNTPPLKFPFNWFPQRVRTQKVMGDVPYWGSSFPFNWFPQRVRTLFPQSWDGKSGTVSIQLVSSASEDFRVGPGDEPRREFPFNWFPQRVRTEDFKKQAGESVDGFPFNWFPQRVRTYPQESPMSKYAIGFHSIGFLSE